MSCHVLRSGVFTALSFSWLIAQGASGAEPTSADLCIYGATPAGIVAGVAAAREGASVVIIEPTRWIGGLVTGGLTHTDKGREDTIGGLAREYFTKAAARSPGTPLWFAEPHVNMATFQALLQEFKIPVVVGQPLASVLRQGKRIVSLTSTDGRTFAAKMFIDASYEGDLLAQGGVSCIVGRESRETYGESLAGCYPMPIRERSAEIMGSVCPCLGGTGPHYIHGTPCKIPAHDASGKLLFGVHSAHAAPGSGDHLTQSYNFRICVTQRPDIRVPFPKPDGYDPARYELLLRLIQSYPQVRFGRLVHLGQIANGKFDLNAQGLFSTDYAGGNEAYPDADWITRRKIYNDHVNYVQGFLWFLGHDERVPRDLRDETNAWGLCRDEFTDNHHWPYALYVREGRRMIGEYVLTQRDIQNDIVKPDSVGMGSFVIDCHIVQRIVAEDGTVTDEGSFPDAPARPYQIPYRGLTPKRTECENLLAPVCLSASHIACCSLRMEPVFMALGHASGVSAALAIRDQQAVQDVNISQLRARLLEQQQVLELKGISDGPTTQKIGGIIQDDAQAELTGTWQDSTYGNPVDGASQHDYNAEKGTKSATFTLKVPDEGKYEVRLAYVASTNRATNVPVTIQHADGSTETTVNERLPPPLDRLFAPLGTYRFTPDRPAVVIIRTAGTDGFVSIDAVQLVPAR